MLTIRTLTTGSASVFGSISSRYSHLSIPLLSSHSTETMHPEKRRVAYQQPPSYKTNVCMSITS